TIARLLLGLEQGRGEPPLPAPLLSLGVEQAAADSFAEHIVIERLLGIALGLLEQDPLNEDRIHDVKSLQPQPPVQHGWFFVEILAPARDRVRDHAQYQHREGEASLGRDRPLGYGRGYCHHPDHPLAWALWGSCKLSRWSIKVFCGDPSHPPRH